MAQMNQHLASRPHRNKVSEWEKKNKKSSSSNASTASASLPNAETTATINSNSKSNGNIIKPKEETKSSKMFEFSAMVDSSDDDDSSEGENAIKGSDGSAIQSDKLSRVDNQSDDEIASKSTKAQKKKMKKIKEQVKKNQILKEQTMDLFESESGDDSNSDGDEGINASDDSSDEYREKTNGKSKKGNARANLRHNATEKESIASRNAHASDQGGEYSCRDCGWTGDSRNKCQCISIHYYFFVFFFFLNRQVISLY